LEDCIPEAFLTVFAPGEHPAIATKKRRRKGWRTSAMRRKISNIMIRAPLIAVDRVVRLATVVLAFSRSLIYPS